MSSVPTSALYLPSAHTLLLPCPTDINLGSVFKVIGNFTQATSLDERIRLTLGIQRWPRTEILGRTVNQDPSRDSGMGLFK